MKTLRAHHRAFHDAGALHVLMQPWGFPADDVLLTKNGGLAAVYRVDGVDIEGLDHPDRAKFVKQKEGALRQTVPGTIWMEYLIKTAAPEMAPATHGDPVVAEMHARRTSDLNQQPSWRFERYLVLIDHRLTPQQFTPASLRERLRQMVDPIQTVTFAATALERALARLETMTAELQSTLRDHGLTRLQKGDILTFLRRLVSDGTMPPDGRVPDTRVDEAMVHVDAEDHRGTLVLGRQTRVRVLTMLDPPTQSFAGFVQKFEQLPGPFILCLLWRRIDNEEMRARLRARRHFFFVRTLDWRTDKKDLKAPVLKNVEKEAMADDHAEAIKALEYGRVFGDCSLTLCAMGETDKALDDLSAAARTVMAEHDGTFHQEVYWTLRSWTGIVPGNDADNKRIVTLPETAFADLSPTTFARHMGTQDGAMATFETPYETPFFLQPQIGRSPHMLLVGSTGSGKSVIGNFLVLSGLSVFGRVVIFDVGGSYRHLAQAMGWPYHVFTLDGADVTINPFIGEGTPDEINFLQAWVTRLIQGTDGYRVTADATETVTQRIRDLMARPAHKRRLSSLVYALPQELQNRLAPWIDDGRYAALFDHTADTLHDATGQVFDLEALYREPANRIAAGPLFSLLFHRERRWQAQATAPTLQVMEELWMEGTEDELRQNLEFGLRGGRKLHLSMLLITQSVEDLDALSLRPVVLQNCATKMFVHTDHFDRAHYRDLFGLNDMQLDLLADLKPRREVAIIDQERTRRTVLRMDPITSDLCISESMRDRRANMR